MAINPMQRRSNTALLLGIGIGLLVTALVAAVLYMQINKKDAELKKERGKRQNIEVAKRDIKANEEIKPEDFVSENIVTSIPKDMIVTSATLNEALTKPQQTGETTAKVNKKASGFYVDAKNTKQAFSLISPGKQDNNQQNPPAKEGNNGDQGQGQAQTQLEQENSIIAKIDIPKGAIITVNMISAKSTDIKKRETERLVEYNMISLPSYLQEKETIDVRLVLPNGQDYIVLSKKIVEKTDADSVWLKLSEDEIEIMSSAIVDSYMIDGSKLYAVNYTDPGLQKSTKVFYPANAVVEQLIKNANPNISTNIKNQLYANNIRQTIEQVISQTNKPEERTSKVHSAVQKDVKSKEDKRKKYLEELNGTEEN